MSVFVASRLSLGAGDGLARLGYPDPSCSVVAEVCTMLIGSSGTSLIRVGFEKSLALKRCVWTSAIGSTAC